MISNTSYFPTLAGVQIGLHTIKKKTKVCSRATKIICTIGPACCDVDTIGKMIDGGMNIARFNLSNVSSTGDCFSSEYPQWIKNVRQAALNKQQHIAIILDIRGSEVRTGRFEEGKNEISVTTGSKLTITGDFDFLGNEEKISCSYSDLASKVKPGQEIVIAHGKLYLKVLSCNESAGEVECEVLNNATIGQSKNLRVPGVDLGLPFLSESDVEDIKSLGVGQGVDFITAPYVRSSSDVHLIKEQLGERGQGIKIISKIQTLQGVKNFLPVLRASDGILIQRGVLGMELPPEKVFLAQKYMIREANIHGKPVITASEMLESMINNPRPTRAECSDVANAVIDGTDCVMLSSETAYGQNVVASVEILARTVVEAETSSNMDELYIAVRNSTRKRFGSVPASESIASSAVKTAYDVNAKMILVMSETGTTARQIAKFRPSFPVVVLTPSLMVCRQTSGLYRGVYAYQVTSLDATDRLTEDAANDIIMANAAKEGDLMVVVCGKTFGMGATSQVRVETMKLNYWTADSETHSSAHFAGRAGDFEEKKNAAFFTFNTAHM